MIYIFYLMLIILYAHNACIRMIYNHNSLCKILESGLVSDFYN